LECVKGDFAKMRADSAGGNKNISNKNSNDMIAEQITLVK
jgi:hypothetical protein